MAAPCTFQGIRKALANLSSSSEDVSAAVSSLNELVSSSVARGDSVWLELQSLGVVKMLLGILRSSSDVGVLAQTVRAIALLAHDNDEAKLALGEMDIVCSLVDLLAPRLATAASSRPEEKQSCHKAWVEVYEQALIALRKLTCLCPRNQQQLAQIGGIKLVIELCAEKTFLQNFSHFSSESKQHLERFVLREKLVCRVAPVRRSERETVLSSFSVFNKVSSLLVSQYPAFHVDLASFQDEMWIANAMVSTGTVWPDQAPFPDGEKWTCVYVTCVEDGGHVWCQFCSKEENPHVKAMCDSLAALEPPDLATSNAGLAPAIGDVYAAYCCAGQSQAGWCRARLLYIQPDGSLELLAVDFGSAVLLPPSHLRPLPLECRGIPPQAIPCKLHSVAPPPASVVLLESCAAILRNMSFEKNAFRKEIKTFRGIEALLELAQCPDRVVVQQALGALLNLAVSETLRPELGTRGTVKLLLKLAEAYAGDREVLEQCVGCLFNMLLCCHDNVTLLKDAHGCEILKKLLTRQNPTSDVAQCIRGIMKNVPSGGGVELSRKNKYMPKEDALYRARLRANGELCRSKPILCCMPDAESVEGEDPGGWDDSELPEDQNQTVQAVSGGVVSDRVLEYGSRLPQGEDSAHVYWGVVSMHEVPRGALRRSICALANRSQPGAVWFGVQRDGTVKGLKMTPRERDQTSVVIDQLMGSLTPRINFNQYNISYIPVAYTAMEVAANHFVVRLEVHCEEGGVRTVSEKIDSCSQQHCYYRQGPCNERLSFQQLRDVVARREAEKFRTELLGLQDDVETLRLRVNRGHMTTPGDHVTLKQAEGEK